MTASRDPERLIRAFLDEGLTELPDRVYDAVRSDIDRTRQRVVIVPWRTPQMNTYAKLAIGVAAVAVVAVVGINLLPGGGAGVGGTSTVSPSPSPLPLASPSPSPLPGPGIWPTGALQPGRHEATMNGITFSFDLPTSGWSSVLFKGMLTKGTEPNPDFRWIGLGMEGPPGVATDPCAGKARLVGPSVDDLATAMTTIPDTQASGPVDVTVGGLPAKLVQLTIDADMACRPSDEALQQPDALSSFNLYGEGTTYPVTLDSVIKEWVLEVDGKRVIIHSDQAAPDPEIEREIQQIVDSIQFE
jgi:hypothetical protein